MPKGYVVITTVSSVDQAEKIAKTIVESKLAACVSVIPSIKSIYLWQDQLETTTEHLLLIKVTETRVNDLLEYLEQYHPYECPELIALPASQIGKKYLSWMCGLDKTIDQEATDSE